MVKKEKKEDSNFILCSYCNKKVYPKQEKYVQLKTYETEKVLMEDKIYHFRCWLEYFEDCVQKKMECYAKQLVEGLDKAVGIIKNEND